MNADMSEDNGAGTPQPCGRSRICWPSSQRPSLARASPTPTNHSSLRHDQWRAGRRAPAPPSGSQRQVGQHERRHAIQIQADAVGAEVPDQCTSKALMARLAHGQNCGRGTGPGPRRPGRSKRHQDAHVNRSRSRHGLAPIEVDGLDDAPGGRTRQSAKPPRRRSPGPD